MPLNIYMENTQPQLTLADLASLKQIIDAACTRGAFKAAEMKSCAIASEDTQQHAPAEAFLEISLQKKWQIPKQSLFMLLII